MAGGLVQTQAQVRAIGVKVAAIPTERCDDIKARADTALVTDTAGLRKVVNGIGYHDQYADRLVAGGVTFVP